MSKKNEINQLKSAANYLGILQLTKSAWINQRKKIKNLDQKKIEKLIIDRDKARKEKNFEEADKIRNKLAIDNIILEDTEIDYLNNWEAEKFRKSIK